MPVSKVDGLPAESPLVFVVSWSGNDDSGEVAAYDIYVSVDGTDYVPWMEDCTGTEATFVGELGRKYEFYSVAKDGVGHVEDAPSTPDAATTVSFGPGDVTGDRNVNFDDLAKLAASWSGYEGSVDIATDGILNWLDLKLLADHWLEITAP